MGSAKYAIAHTLGSQLPIEIGLWLDYICPFSKKLFNTVYTDVIPAVQALYPGRVIWTFNHQVQPWHPQGAVLHEYALAVSHEAPELFWLFSKALFDASASFYDEAVVDRTRNQLLADLGKIAAEAGVDHSRVLERVRIEAGEPENKGSPTIGDLKYYIKLGRQTGIHVSPTVVIDGLVDNTPSSSWDKDQWLRHLEGLMLS